MGNAKSVADAIERLSIRITVEMPPGVRPVLKVSKPYPMGCDPDSPFCRNYVDISVYGDDGALYKKVTARV
jgi:hypothetical protein